MRALREQLEIGVNLPVAVDMDLAPRRDWRIPGLPLNVEVNSKQLTGRSLLESVTADDSEN